MHMYDNVLNYTCYFTSFRVMYIHGKDALLRIGDLKLSAIFCWIGGLATASFSTLHILEYQVSFAIGANWNKKMIHIKRWLIGVPTHKLKFVFQEISPPLQGSARRRSPGLVNFVPAVAYYTSAYTIHATYRIDLSLRT